MRLARSPVPSGDESSTTSSVASGSWPRIAGAMSGRFSISLYVGSTTHVPVRTSEVTAPESTCGQDARLMRRAGPPRAGSAVRVCGRRLRPAGVDGGSVGDLNAHRRRQQALRAHRINRPDLVEVGADGAWPIGERSSATDAGDQPAVAEQLVLGATKVVDGYRVPLQLYVAIRQRLGAQPLWRGWDVDEGRRGPAAQLLATPLCTGERQVAGHGPLEGR